MVGREGRSLILMDQQENGQDIGHKKTKDDQKRGKGRKCRKDERSKRKTKQGVGKHIKQDKADGEKAEEKIEERGRV